MRTVEEVNQLLRDTQAFQEGEHFTAASVMKALNLSKNSAATVLYRMVNNGELDRCKKGNLVLYSKKQNRNIQFRANHDELGG